MSPLTPMTPDSPAEHPGTGPGAAPGTGTSSSMDESDAIPLRPMLILLAVILSIGLGAIAWSSLLADDQLPSRRPRQDQVRAGAAGVEFSLFDQAAGARLRTQQRHRRLLEYAWIAGEPGIARIPIDEAMAAWLAEERQ